MNISDILKMCDHTLLAQNATPEQIKKICDDGIRFNAASVCIPPCYVKQAKDYVKDALKICTVIGFPNGYSTTDVKVFETKDAIANGSDEIDMVINIGALKDKNYEYVSNEIKMIKDACCGRTLKVIIECCLLTDEEKALMCKIVSESGADYIKTSTGFSNGGATFEDIALFKRHVSNNVMIKAAGGISSIEDAEKFIELGASRLGTSKIVSIAKNDSTNGSY